MSDEHQLHQIRYSCCWGILPSSGPGSQNTIATVGDSSICTIKHGWRNPFVSSICFYAQIYIDWELGLGRNRTRPTTSVCSPRSRKRCAYMVERAHQTTSGTLSIYARYLLVTCWSTHGRVDFSVMRSLT